MLDTLPPAPRARADRAARFGGPAAGALLALLLARGYGEPGTGALLAVPAFGVCAMAGVLLGEHLGARPRGTVRTAGLAPRRVRDHVPPRLTALLLVEAALLVVLLAVAARTGAADDLGRAGRVLRATCAGATETHGPWPGSFYTVPALAALGLGTGAGGYALRRVVRRPGDDGERRGRAAAVTAAWGLLVSTLLAGTTWSVAGALRGLSCAGTSGSVAAWLLLATCLVSFGTAAWCLFGVTAPRGAGVR